ncbi:MAG TPA: hypothetical protein VK808_09295, partial [Bacteroidia bacterium]|nr:hypothetical protein [Bacteroidia bacterium]
SKDTLASKLLEADSATNEYSTKDSIKKDTLVKIKDSTMAIHHDSLGRESSHARHDSLSQDSSRLHHDSIPVHKIIHGSDTLQFNQIKGKNMKGYFKDNKIYKIYVSGNAQTIYYVYTDNNNAILGANRADCSYMIIFIVLNKINSITFLQKPDATLFPIKEVKPTDFLLGGFRWHERERPRTIVDIFRGSE